MAISSGGPFRAPHGRRLLIRSSDLEAASCAQRLSTTMSAGGLCPHYCQLGNAVLPLDRLVVGGPSPPCVCQHSFLDHLFRSRTNVHTGPPFRISALKRDSFLGHLADLWTRTALQTIFARSSPYLHHVRGEDAQCPSPNRSVSGNYLLVVFRPVVPHAVSSSAGLAQLAPLQQKDLNFTTPLKNCHEWARNSAYSCVLTAPRHSSQGDLAHSAVWIVLLQQLIATR